MGILLNTTRKNERIIIGVICSIVYFLCALYVLQFPEPSWMINVIIPILVSINTTFFMILTIFKD